MLFQRKLIPLLIFVFIINLMLCGCDNDDNNPATTISSKSEPEHDGNVHIETAGRLLISDAKEPILTVLDLDNGHILARYNLITPASAILTSPAKRYGLIVQQQGNQNQESLVQLVDGGIWQENHGDHLHDYQTEPRFLEVTFAGTRFHHYTVNDELGALFFNGDMSLAIPSKVLLLSDYSLGEGREEAVLTLDVPMAGIAIPIGDWLLTTHREPDADTFWPSQVVLYKRHGETFEFQRRFEELCPGLRDSITVVDHTTFSCEDGVLVIEHQGSGDAIVFEAQKIRYSADFPEETRIRTFIGHPDWNHLLGLAYPDYLFSIDPQVMTIMPIIRLGDFWFPDAFMLDAVGQRLLIFNSWVTPPPFPIPARNPYSWDVNSVVRVFDTHDWHIIWEPLQIRAMRLYTSFTRDATRGKNHFIYILFPHGVRESSQVHEIDLNTLTMRSFEVEGTPNHIAYVGMEEHEHEGLPLSLSLLANRFGIEQMLKTTPSTQFMVSLLYFHPVLAGELALRARDIRARGPEQGFGIRSGNVRTSKPSALVSQYTRSVFTSNARSRSQRDQFLSIT